MFGNDKADCPLWRAPCRENKCRWWTHVIGANPNTGETVNKQGCAIEFLPMLLIENSQQTRQAGASIDRFNDDMVKMNGVLQIQKNILDSSETPLIEAVKN